MFYVYAYISSKTLLPYYIGKGKNDRAFRKHGRVSVPKDKSFIVFLEMNLTEIGALALERRYVRWYGRRENDTGILLNLTDGGEGASGRIFTKEQREAVSRIKKGTKHSDKTKALISEKGKGRKQTEESLAKQRKTCIERYGVDYPILREEIKDKLLASKIQTLIERYGVDHQMKIPGVAKKVQEKTKVNNLIKYGVEHSSQREDVKIKRKESQKDYMLKTYGVEHWGKTEQGRLHLQALNEQRKHSTTLYQCPHCEKNSTNKSNMTRFHFDNCRQKS